MGSSVSEKETVPCNEQPCNARADCELSEWHDWEACSNSCGVGQQLRRRVITQQATADGLGCSGETQKLRICVDNPPCNHDKDCVWGDWSQWSACTCDCDGGQ